MEIPPQKKTQAVAAKSMGCSPQTDSKDPLLKIIPTELIEHGDVEMEPT